MEWTELMAMNEWFLFEFGGQEHIDSFLLYPLK